MIFSLVVIRIFRGVSIRSNRRINSTSFDCLFNMDVSGLRIQYASTPFLEDDLVSKNDPMKQFDHWFTAAMECDKEGEPNAACLSTCTPDGHPSSRMLLVKKFDDRGFIFYTNHSSRKGREMTANPNACLLFFWPSLHRQVRVEGEVNTIPEEESDEYFNSRPAGNKLSAIVSKQSQVVASRAELQAAHDKLKASVTSDDCELKRPSTWGGFVLKPRRYEFWQGQSNRLHDRITFTKDDNSAWVIERIAP